MVGAGTYLIVTAVTAKLPNCSLRMWHFTIGSSRDDFKRALPHMVARLRNDAAQQRPSCTMANMALSSLPSSPFLYHCLLLISSFLCPSFFFALLLFSLQQGLIL